MTDDRLNGLENRMDRVETALVSAGDFLTQASSIIQQNTSRLDRMEELLVQTFEIAQRTAESVASLTAASERHDRILDYLLSREAGQGNGSSNGGN